MVKKLSMYVGPHDVYSTIDVNFSMLTREIKSLSTIFSLQILFVINVLNYKTIMALKLA